nr:hypothetical protein Iba_scaffold16111CG0010 [Ipomoea batatas]
MTYLYSQVVPSMFSTTYESEGRNRKKQIGFSRKISNVFIKWNLKIKFTAPALQAAMDTAKMAFAPSSPCNHVQKDIHSQGSTAGGRSSKHAFVCVQIDFDCRNASTVENLPRFQLRYYRWHGFSHMIRLKGKLEHTMKRTGSEVFARTAALTASSSFRESMCLSRYSCTDIFSEVGRFAEVEELKVKLRSYRDETEFLFSFSDLFEIESGDEGATACRDLVRDLHL